MTMKELQTLAFVVVLIAASFAGIGIAKRMLDQSFVVTPPQSIAASRNLEEDK